MDGKDIAFQIAGAMAMREAVQKASPVILEPIVNVNVIVPERFTGDIMGLLELRSAVTSAASIRWVTGGGGERERSSGGDVHVPGGVRAMTQGRGRYSMSFASTRRCRRTSLRSSSRHKQRTSRSIRS